MSMEIAEFRLVDCAGCDRPFAAFLTDLRPDGRRYCEPCATEYDAQANDCERSDNQSYNESRGV